MPEDLLRTAIRVLSCCIDNRAVKPEDLATLRASVTAAEAGMAVDDLANYIAQCEMERRRAERGR